MPRKYSTRIIRKKSVGHPGTFTAPSSSASSGCEIDSWPCTTDRWVRSGGSAGGKTGKTSSEAVVVWKRDQEVSNSEAFVEYMNPLDHQLMIL